ncbi:MAG: CotH kinase family protein [Bacteroidaceae bacterium]|nr:CotH kinase family protein [Bacteroidaceae bacterium]
MKKLGLFSGKGSAVCRVVLSACVMFVSAGTSRAQLVINEIMQSNVDCLFQDNQYPDSWVELYNAGKNTEKLSEYKLGLSDKANEASKLFGNNDWGWGWGWGWGGSSEKEIKPGERVLIYCDQESGDQHTNFRLESGKGCVLFLFKNDKLTDQLPDTLKKQPAPNIAYGREKDGGKEWGYMLKATPNAANSGGICDRKQILDDPVFSVPAKVFRQGEEFALTIELPKDAPEGTKIYYTTDGSEPTTSSKNSTSVSMTINKSTVVRAKAICKGWLSPRSLTQSYVCLDRDVTLPVFSLVTDKKHFYDNSTGILASANVTDKSKEWRRPVNVEFFEDTNLDSCVVNQLCETRVSGNWTRRFPLRTLAVYANKRFGTKHFKYEFFPELRPGSKDFKSVLLRNSGNDFPFLYSRDAILQAQMAKHCDVDWQAGRPAIIFINGEYKGMVNIRERSNDDGIYSNYDGLEDIDMVENWGELKAGSQQNWNDFNNFKNSTHTYQQWEKQLDVKEFINVMIANVVHCNLDFPGNNICFWRPSAADGRWRVQMKDVDYSFGIYDRPTNTNTSDIMNGDVYKIKVDYDYIKWLYNSNYDSHYSWGNGSGSTALFRNLMQNTQFKNEFLDRLAIYMGDFLSFEQTWEDTWEPWSKSIEEEIKYHRELYGLAADGYQKELEKAKTWLQTRIPYVYQHEQSYYKLGAVTPITIYKDVEGAPVKGENNSHRQNDTDLTFNDVKLSRSYYNGSFFANRSITLESAAVDGWEITEDYGTGEPVQMTVEGPKLSYKIPTGCRGVSVVARTETGNGVMAQYNLDDEAAQEFYDMSGRRLSSPQRGVNIIKTRNGVKKVMTK